MTIPQHTPGPWSPLPEKTPIRVTGPKGEQIAAVYGGFVGETEQLFNARLIAAAPALRDYVARRASEGDEEARAVIARLEASTDGEK